MSHSLFISCARDDDEPFAERLYGQFAVEDLT